MTISKKTFRYYYWVSLEFIKKHLRIFLLSFLLSFIIIVSLISFSPYIQTLFLTKKDVIGVIGEFDYNSLPDEVIGKISNALLFINEKGEFIPTIASTWEIADDGKEYRFHIRDGLIWSDGKKFDAKDIPYQFKDIETKVIDDKTIYFKLKKPLPIFPTYLKKHIPFIVYKFYKTETDLVNAYKTGEINQMLISKKSVVDIFKNWKNSSVSKSVDYTRLLTLFFNFNNSFLKQKEVRQAINMAIDKSKFKDSGEISLGPITPISWAYSLNLKNPVFDPSSAEEILKKSGNASESSQLKFFTYYDYLNDAEEIVRSLKDAGLEVNLNLASSEKPANFDLFLAFWNVPSDPDQYFFWHSTQKQGNLGEYKNVKIDKLLEDARNTGSVDDRKELYEEFQRVISDDPPAAFFYFPYIYTVK